MGRYGILLAKTQRVPLATSTGVSFPLNVILVHECTAATVATMISVTASMS